MCSAALYNSGAFTTTKKETRIKKEKLMLYLFFLLV